MGEVLFYHLTDTPLERSLPQMLEMSLKRGWRVLVRSGSLAAVGAMDDHLWRYSDDGFLPHGAAGGNHDAAQPILLTTQTGNPNQAQVLMLIDGARVDPGEAKGFDRLCLIFNGHEPDAVEAARADWLAVKEAGLSGKYWAQQGGKWVEKAST